MLDKHGLNIRQDEGKYYNLGDQKLTMKAFSLGGFPAVSTPGQTQTMPLCRDLHSDNMNWEDPGCSSLPGSGTGHTSDTMMCQEATVKNGFLNFAKGYYQNSLSINKLFRL